MTETSENLIARLCEVTSDVKSSFGGLTADQLNWKPLPDKWSVAQCIDHLITTNRAYFKRLEEVVGGDLRPNLWSRIPFWSGLVGYLIKRSVDPQNRKKMKTFPVFEPSQSDVPDSIIEDFADCQEKLMSYIRQTDHLDRKKIKIASPVSDKAPLTLASAFEILVIHERRHFDQAVEVTGTNGFPAA
ncbi:MAG: DinB family protein [Aridibacter famidurans]|nr:DinB family protein [Aridibacter famidurans]